MIPIQLLLAVGCPGSGKTHYLDCLMSRGELDIVNQDGLENENLWVQAVPQITRDLDAKKRVGICGQTMTTRWRRQQITDIFGERAHFVFFEPNYGACLINIVKATLAGAPHAWHRACCVYAIEKEGRYQAPPDVDLLPVHRQRCNQDEVEKFFRLVKDREKRAFSVEGEARLRELIAEQL